MQHSRNSICSSRYPIVAAAATLVAAADTLSWASLVELKATAEESYVKPVRMKNGVSFFNIFVTPTAMAKLKQDSDFLANIRNSMPRSSIPAIVAIS